MPKKPRSIERDFQSLLDAYLAHSLKNRGSGPLQSSVETRAARSFSGFLGADRDAPLSATPLFTASSEDLERFLETKANSTAVGYHFALRRFYEFLVDIGSTQANPADDLAPLPAEATPSSEKLTEAEWTALLSAVESSGVSSKPWLARRGIALLKMYRNMGVLPGEAETITVAMVREGVAALYQVRQRNVRRVPFDPEVSAAIDAYLGSLPVTLEPGDFIFRVDDGTAPARANNMNRKIVLLAEAHGLRFGMKLIPPPSHVVDVGDIHLGRLFEQYRRLHPRWD